METFQKLNIALIQSELIWENPALNRQAFEAKINALDTTVDLIILPEMFTTGFTMNAVSFAENMQGTTIAWMQKIAKTQQVAITGSLIIEENNLFYNRLVFVHPTGEIDTYDKRHSFTLAKENETFSNGIKKLIVTYKGWKICPLICYDLRFPAWSRNKEDYDLLIYVASWPEKRSYAWDHLLKARAIENLSYTIGVNRVGKDANGFTYNGHSIAINFLGEPITKTNFEKEATINIRLDKNEQNCIRKKLGFLNDQDSFKIDNL